MKYKIVANLDEKKYKSCEGMDPNLWPMLKDKVYTLNTWPSLKWAQWSMQSYKSHEGSNLDLDSIRIIEVQDEE